MTSSRITVRLTLAALLRRDHGAEVASVGAPPFLAWAIAVASNRCPHLSPPWQTSSCLSVLLSVPGHFSQTWIRLLSSSRCWSKIHAPGTAFGAHGDLAPTGCPGSVCPSSVFCPSLALGTVIPPNLGSSCSLTFRPAKSLSAKCYLFP